MPAGDQIEIDTRALCLPRGRRVGQPGHDTALAYVRSRLGEIGLRPFAGDVFDLPYEAPHPDTGMPQSFTNLVGVIRGRDETAPPLLIGAHYDSVIDAPCADDNATAVAVALAAAEALVGAGLDRNVIIAIFDAEEPPFFLSPSMGSIRFWEDHCAGLSLACALVMDLIGHDVELGVPVIDTLLPRVRSLLFVLGSESHDALPDVVERVAPRIDGLRVMASLNRYIGDMSDHHAFRVGGQPYLFLSCGQGRYYHDPLDTPEWVNFTKVRQVNALVVALMRELDRAPLTGGAAPHDPVAFEIRMIKRAMGPILPLLLARMGTIRLARREDIDRLAGGLARSFLSR